MQESAFIYQTAKMLQLQAPQALFLIFHFLNVTAFFFFTSPGLAADEPGAKMFISESITALFREQVGEASKERAQMKCLTSE